MKGASAIALAALIGGCSQPTAPSKSAACGPFNWAKPTAPYKQWTLGDHQANVEGCVLYNSGRLASSPDSAWDVADAVVDECHFPLMGLWMAEPGADRGEFSDLEKQERTNAHTDIVEYRAAGCKRAA